MNNQPFVIERVLNAPVNAVWRAISDRDEMEQWYFKLPEFKAEIGFEFSFVGCADDGTNYTHLCKITSLIPQEKLAYSWVYEGYEGYSEVSFELFAEGNKTRLKLTHTGLETFPVNNPDFRRESFAAGWTSILDESLKTFLEKQSH
jgi:uncharacterized protein YndB with AHSA1/START domain